MRPGMPVVRQQAAIRWTDEVDRSARPAVVGCGCGYDVYRGRLYACHHRNNCRTDFGSVVDDDPHDRPGHFDRGLERNDGGDCYDNDLASRPGYVSSCRRHLFVGLVGRGLAERRRSAGERRGAVPGGAAR